MTATLVSVAPQKRGTLTDAEQARIRAALDAHTPIHGNGGQ